MTPSTRPGRVVHLLTSIILLSAAGCGGLPRESSVPVAASSEEIAERFLEARRRGRTAEVWHCLAGATDRKRVYRGRRRAGDLRTWDEFRRDFDLGWKNPPLAPADVWEKVGERTGADGELRILLYRQGTDDEPDRGMIEIATCPSGSGWLVAWVDRAR